MAKIGHPTPALIVTDDERSALTRLTKRARVNRALAFRPRTISDEDVEAVIVKTLETTPPGETH